MPLTEKRVVVSTVLALLALSAICVALHTRSKHGSIVPVIAQTASATLKISADSGIATLNGVVPDQVTKASLINSAEKVFGLSNVVDKLEINSKLAEPIWVDQAKAAVPLL